LKGQHQATCPSLGPVDGPLQKSPLLLQRFHVRLELLGEDCLHLRWPGQRVVTHVPCWNVGWGCSVWKSNDTNTRSLWRWYFTKLEKDNEYFPLNGGFKMNGGSKHFFWPRYF
jgi:hypothetical protein